MSHRHTHTTLATLVLAGLICIMFVFLAGPALALGDVLDLGASYPSPNSSNAPVDSTVVLTYSAEIDATSVSSQTIVLPWHDDWADQREL